MSDNIVLDYPMTIERWSGDGTTWLYTDKAEFFMDEHGIQWIKFVAKNGYKKHHETMMRTDTLGFAIIRDKS